MATKPYHSAQLTQFDDDGDSYEEEAEQKGVKIEQARRIFKEMMADKESTRTDVIERFEKEVKVTHSTAVSYYTRFRKEFGLSDEDETAGNPMAAGMGAEGNTLPQGAPGDEGGNMPVIPEKPEIQEFENPDRAGVIRVVNNAHLIYKRQTEDGTFEELWIYNIHNATNDELDIRKDILAGTDIPVKKTKSADGSQSYQLVTMGNAQMMKISGLPN